MFNPEKNYTVQVLKDCFVVGRVIVFFVFRGLFGLLVNYGNYSLSEF